MQPQALQTPALAAPLQPTLGRPSESSLLRLVQNGIDFSDPVPWLCLPAFVCALAGGPSPPLAAAVNLMLTGRRSKASEIVLAPA